MSSAEIAMSPAATVSWWQMDETSGSTMHDSVGTNDGSLHSVLVGQAGFAGLYKLLGREVVPVAVLSGPFYHRWIKRRGTIRVVFGDPLPAGLPRDEIEAKVHAAINALNT